MFALLKGTSLPASFTPCVVGIVAILCKGWNSFTTLCFTCVASEHGYKKTVHQLLYCAWHALSRRQHCSLQDLLDSYFAVGYFETEAFVILPPSFWCTTARRSGLQMFCMSRCLLSDALSAPAPAQSPGLDSQAVQFSNCCLWKKDWLCADSPILVIKEDGCANCDPSPSVHWLIIQHSRVSELSNFYTN